VIWLLSSALAGVVIVLPDSESAEEWEPALEYVDLEIGQPGDDLWVRVDDGVTWTIALMRGNTALREITHSPPKTPEERDTIAVLMFSVLQEYQSPAGEPILEPVVPTYGLAGTVEGVGLAGLQLQLGDEVLTIAGNGPFAFDQRFEAGTAFQVLVVDTPTDHTCSLSGGSGTLADSDVTDVTVRCVQWFPIRATVTGTEGLSVQIALADEVRDIDEDGDHDVALMAVGSNWSLFVTPPQGIACGAEPAQGIIAGPVDVNVQCGRTSWSLTGNVEGLLGEGLVLRAVGLGDFTPESTDFDFPYRVLHEWPFAVTVLNMPTAPRQTCLMGDSTGIATNDIALAIACTTDTFPLRAAVSGLDGAMVFQTEKQTLVVNANGTTTFPQALDDGSKFSVTVATPPEGQRCAMVEAEGVINGGAHTVVATCEDIPKRGWSVWLGAGASGQFQSGWGWAMPVGGTLSMGRGPWSAGVTLEGWRSAIGDDGNTKISFASAPRARSDVRYGGSFRWTSDRQISPFFAINSAISHRKFGVQGKTVPIQIYPHAGLSLGMAVSPLSALRWSVRWDASTEFRGTTLNLVEGATPVQLGRISWGPSLQTEVRLARERR
jgi:hypothetical protein